jgi:hypothetical protein
MKRPVPPQKRHRPATYANNSCSLTICFSSLIASKRFEWGSGCDDDAACECGLGISSGVPNGTPGGCDDDAACVRASVATLLGALTLASVWPSCVRYLWFAPSCDSVRDSVQIGLRRCSTAVTRSLPPALHGCSTLLYPGVAPCAVAPVGGKHRHKDASL